MSNQDMVYCLIAFILGYLLSINMGNGFSVGGVKDDKYVFFDNCDPDAWVEESIDCEKLKWQNEYISSTIYGPGNINPIKHEPISAVCSGAATCLPVTVNGKKIENGGIQKLGKVNLEYDMDKTAKWSNVFGRCLDQSLPTCVK